MKERTLISTKVILVGEEQNIAAVRNLLKENAHASARCNPVDISFAGFNRITRLGLKWHPYRTVCIFDTSFWQRTYEALYVRQYSPKGHPPEFNIRRNDSHAKITVLVTQCRDGLVFGPRFFKGNVNGILYLQMLIEFVFPKLNAHFGNQH